MTPLERARSAIVACERCPRLRRYCARVARQRRRAYRDEVYWGRPVPGFGDSQARILIVGLAPAAHGANRTGRLFTGDGPGGSGDFLMAALHATGFASHPTSTRADDGLRLRDAYIVAVVRCAPPANRPLASEIARCRDHLDAEVAALRRVSVVVALGRVATEACLQWFERQGWQGRRPRFVHGGVFRPDNELPSPRPPTRRSRLPTLLMSYHPSRQNTQTGRLTAAMLRDVFLTARQELDRGCCSA